MRCVPGVAARRPDLVQRLFFLTPPIRSNAHSLISGFAGSPVGGRACVAPGRRAWVSRDMRAGVRGLATAWTLVDEQPRPSQGAGWSRRQWRRPRPRRAGAEAGTSWQMMAIGRSVAERRTRNERPRREGHRDWICAHLACRACASTASQAAATTDHEVSELWWPPPTTLSSCCCHGGPQR